jgi:two-component system, cell cycle response regulator DivK
MSESHKNHLILVVEDNVLNMELVCDLLEAYGFQVARAGEAEECLEQMKQRIPDLILMDLQLPGIDGYTLVRKIKSTPEYAQCYVVALTAYAMPGDQEKAAAAGCQGMITKPIDTRLFPRQIEKYLQDKQGL